jgi:hypothetical protein
LRLIVAAFVISWITLAPPREPRRWIAAAAAILLLLAAVEFTSVIVYLLYPGYVDHTEPQIAAVSWMFLRGDPVYPPLERGDIYGLLYGPLLYETNAWILRLVGPSIAASKILGAFAFLGTQVTCAVAFVRGGAKRIEALTLTALLCLIEAGYPVNAFVTRADAPLVLCGALALLVVVSTEGAIAGLILGVLAGLAANLKAHGAIYIIPLIVFHVCRHPRPRLADVAGVCIGCMSGLLVPFAPTNVSLRQYVAYILLANDEGLDPAKALSTALLGASLLFPGCWLYLSSRVSLPRPIWALVVSTLGCMLVALWTGSAIGAGSHHLLPFLPVLGWLCFFIYKTAELPRLRAVVAGVLVVQILTFIPFELFAWRYIGVRYMTLRAPIEEAAEEVRQTIATNPGKTVAIAADDYVNSALPLSFLEPIPVFSGSPLPLDPAAWMDLQQVLPSDTSVRRVLGTCRVDIWLVPKGSPPFGAHSYYTKEPLFSEAAVESFKSAYVKVGSGAAFEEWRCR